MKNLLVAQSGGPTSAINATLAGVITGAKLDVRIECIYGAVNGIQGILEDRLVNLGKKTENCEDMQILAQTPAAFLGSCRLKLNEDKQIEQIIRILRKHEIGWFIYIGGNDSMDTVYKISEYCSRKGIEDFYVIGAPKTIDNDLAETDHCPGFGSAAKYIATTFAELERDCGVYTQKTVTIVEVMGRDAGWLTAASALSRINGGKGPDFIYLCELEFDTEKFLYDVKEKLSIQNSVLIAVSEGVRTIDGRYVSESVQTKMADNFGHVRLSGVAGVLENLVQKKIGCKVRSIELNLMQRCAAHLRSATDIEESKMLGLMACESALRGETGKMSALIRVSDKPYRVEYTMTDINKVANAVKRVPISWINQRGNDITEEMITYLKPLIQGEEHIIYKNGIPVYKNVLA